MKSLIVLSLILTLLISAPVLAGKLVPEPKLPTNAEALRRQTMTCPDGPLVWRVFYDTTGDSEYAEIVTYGRAPSDKPLLWVYFLPDVKGGFTHAILTLLDKPAEQLTDEEFVALSLCELPSYS